MCESHDCLDFTTHLPGGLGSGSRSVRVLAMPSQRGPKGICILMRRTGIALLRDKESDIITQFTFRITVLGSHRDTTCLLTQSTNGQERCPDNCWS